MKAVILAKNLLNQALLNGSAQKGILKGKCLDFESMDDFLKSVDK